MYYIVDDHLCLIEIGEDPSDKRAPVLAIKRTFQPSTVRRKRKIGFLARMGKPTTTYYDMNSMTKCYVSAGSILVRKRL